jgi:hypothetical protein
MPSRGVPLSSAILYLAIVAIWLGVLVPRWLRPRHVIVRTADTRHHGDTTAPDPDTDSDTEPLPQATPQHDHLERRPDAAPAPRLSPAARRAVILRARRRMLLMITGLAAGAVMIAIIHVAAWWVVIPPGFMLGGFIVILREAARTDAQRARQPDVAARTSTAARRTAAAKHVLADNAAHVATTAEREPARTAEIIDISARLGDQLYDQYADAAVRAVGD